MTTRLLTALLLAAAALPPAATAADWPIYGRDLSNTRTAANDGPARDQLADLSKAWEFKSETGDFTGTPVVADGVVVAGDHGGQIYALDAVTGKLLWKRDAGAEINGTAAIDTDARGGATVFMPVAEEGGPRLLALSLADGSKRWETVLTTQEGGSVYGSPTFWDGTIYIGTSGPNNDDATSRGSVVALDERTGAIRWQTFTVPPNHDGAAVWSTPAIDTATGRLYVGTGNNYHGEATDTADAILALDAHSGAIVDHFQATPGDVWAPDNLTGGPDYDFGASPNLFAGPSGQLLVGAGQKSGTYWALDRATLDPVWKTNVGPGGYLGGIMGSTAYDGTRIYGSDAQDGTVFALGRDGKEAWTAKESGATHFGPATVARGVLYSVDPSGAVVARDPATGDELTRLSLDGPSFGGVTASGRALFVAVGIGPPPKPLPQQYGNGSIVAFGDTSRSGGDHGRPHPGPNPVPPGRAKRAKIHLTVAPRRAPAGQRVVLRFRATRGRGSAAVPVRGAKVQLGRKRVHTGRRGRARMEITFTRGGVHRARARKRGMRPGFAPLRVSGGRR